MSIEKLEPIIRPAYWKIRLNYYPFMAFMGILVSSISRESFNLSLRNRFSQSILQIIGFFLVYTFWNVTNYLLTRINHQKLRLWQIMGIGALGGLIMSLNLTFLGWLFDVEFHISSINRTLGDICVATFWLPIQSIVVGNFRRYAKIRLEISEEFSQQESVQIARNRALSKYREKIEIDIQQKLTTTTKEASRLFENLKYNDSIEIPKFLRDISKDYFRISAHKLIETKRKRNRFSNDFLLNFSQFRSALRESVVSRPLNPLWFATIVAVTISVALAEKRNVLVISELLLVNWVSTYLVQKILIIGFHRINSKRIFLTTVATLGNIVLPIIFSRLIPGNAPKIENHVAFVFVILTITLLGHIGQAGILKGEEMRRNSLGLLVKFKLEEDGKNEIFAHITRDWAKFIHGNYTSRLEAIALSLENSLALGNYDEIEMHFLEIESLLKSAKPRSNSNSLILLDEIRDRLGNWQGLIEISFSCELESHEFVQVSIKNVGDCIEEALLNAVRHGDCSSIDIALEDRADSLKLLISDNGVGIKEFSRGFGSSIYEEATSGNWRLFRDENDRFTCLELNFAKIF